MPEAVNLKLFYRTLFSIGVPPVAVPQLCNYKTRGEDSSSSSSKIKAFEKTLCKPAFTLVSSTLIFFVPPQKIDSI